ncbi:MAG TPA: aminotransferase class I/II-fold pyridoxal phosphate-dependent enzyme, partial [Verrucomicrobiae bacterium]|nr:aminotransferase class I/II-fold pyridoxal phosphate-dependent enzyme [Verrucomicrobiae bacterium]
MADNLQVVPTRHQRSPLPGQGILQHIQRTRENNARGLQFFARAFRKMKLEFLPSSANFILVRVGDGQRVFEEMQTHGVIVRPMGGYQLPEWIRITVGTLDQNV